MSHSWRCPRIFKYLLQQAPCYGPVWHEACRFEQRCNHLGEALRVNGVLTELRLGWNKIGDEGAAALASALRVNGVLKHLYIGGNDFGDEGKKAIQGAVSGREGFELEM